MRKDLFELLLITNMTRGTDSTGIGILREGLKFAYFKHTLPAHRFLKEKEVQEYLNSPVQAVIGHTRLASHGAVTPANAHPFKSGNILGAHNGIVDNYLMIDHKVEVDSEVIFKLLNRHHNKFTNVLPKLSGSFAVVWTNLKEPGTVYLVRNHNPLSLAVVPELKTIFWNSEEAPLKAALKAVLPFGMQFDLFNIESNHVYRIDPDLHIRKTPVVFKERYSRSASSGYHHPYWGDDDPSDSYHDYIGKHNQLVLPTKKEDDVVESFDKFGAYQTLITLGCESCRLVPKHFGWLNKVTYESLCADCKRTKYGVDQNDDFEFISFFKMEELRTIKESISGTN